ncbi:Uma2 family endonuclease [Chamaesiphon sp. OTE_75_metabat_556]|jgi:Uma2 family endonuclease|uniref:Uma2 family endonuclease n=1 Tax=Chamaesiphon sp. OTE_75_metabat_556 TaxID=2964692 RepID=UPI00286CBE41|nr:Uma2 family endonuclease [Chamaesiphon sp. OTE_75_metabat_556]
MIQLQEKLKANAWLKSDWDTYVNTIDSPEHEQHQGYYYSGYMRIEDMPTGADHSRYHVLLTFAVNLFCTIGGIAINGFDNCTYRKTEIRECQPDLSYYTGERARLAPVGKSLVNLDEQAIPNLVIEISNTTLEDDLGAKRLLYEEMGISEYWVVDVQNSQVYAFEMFDRGSRRIDISLVLPNLSIATITEALNLSKEQDQSQIGKWLMSEFQT